VQCTYSRIIIYGSRILYYIRKEEESQKLKKMDGEGETVRCDNRVDSDSGMALHAM